jgi:hypothetical protein
MCDAINFFEGGLFNKIIFCVGIVSGVGCCPSYPKTAGSKSVSLMVLESLGFLLTVCGFAKWRIFSTKLQSKHLTLF